MSSKMRDSEFEWIVGGAQKTARFFRLAALVALILGFVGSLGEGWRSSTVTYMGQTDFLPHWGIYFVQAFIVFFGATCLASGVLLFFALVLDLLRAGVVRNGGHLNVDSGDDEGPVGGSEGSVAKDFFNVFVGERGSRKVSAEEEARNPSPGWYPDPAGRAALRWWDGSVWTDQVKDSAGMAQPSDPIETDSTSGAGPSRDSKGEQVRVVCGNCGTQDLQSGRANSWRCSGCTIESFTTVCPSCHAPFVSSSFEGSTILGILKGEIQCPECQEMIKRPTKMMVSLSATRKIRIDAKGQSESRRSGVLDSETRQ